FLQRTIGLRHPGRRRDADHPRPEKGGSAAPRRFPELAANNTSRPPWHSPPRAGKFSASFSATIAPFTLDQLRPPHYGLDQSKDASPLSPPSTVAYLLRPAGTRAFGSPGARFAPPRTRLPPRVRGLSRGHPALPDGAPRAGRGLRSLIPAPAHLRAADGRAAFLRTTRIGRPGLAEHVRRAEP